MNAQTSNSKSVLIVAAESSSELYGARIIEEAKRRGLDFHFFGIGSESMASLGCELVERSEKMAVVGLWEVIAHWRVISSAFNNLLKRSQKLKPRAALLLDYPGFNLRLAERLHKMNVPVIYFISPQVWAWRQARVFLIKRIISKMLLVFPFEKDFYNRFSVPAVFVGHPLLDEIKNAILTPQQKLEVRASVGAGTHDFLIGLLPGSRDSELKNCFKTQIEAARILSQNHKSAKFLVLVAPHLTKEKIEKYIPNDLISVIQIVKDDSFKIIQSCDVCIVASGTATLITALADTPMVIMYRMNSITAFMAKRLVKGAAYFGMPNLILNERAVPELFQEEATPANIAREVTKYMDDPQYRQSVRINLGRIKTRLGTGGSIGRVVDELTKVMSAP